MNKLVLRGPNFIQKKFSAVIHLLGPVPCEVPEVLPGAPPETSVDATQVLHWGSHIVPRILRLIAKHVHVWICCMCVCNIYMYICYEYYL